MRRAARPLRLALAAAALVSVAALAGCGFRPLYGQAGPGSAGTLAAIEIERIPDRSGQVLRNLLLDRLTPEGPPARPAYSLSVRLTESIGDLAVLSDESATRSNLTLNAVFTLTRAPGPEAGVHAATVTLVNSYNRLTSDYATLASENDARERALREIADEIRLRIAAALRTPGAFRIPRKPAEDDRSSR
jgi:LPS-assembly lipoprotein